MNPYKRYRERSGLRQVDVADALDLGQTAVSMWENGECHPRAELLPKLAALYNCTVDQLLEDGDPQ